MLPTEIQDAVQMFEQAMDVLPLAGLALLSIPGVAVAVHVFGQWKILK